MFNANLLIMKPTKVNIQNLILLIAIEFMLSSALALVSGQNINVRANGEAGKPSEVGQPRAIYQKPLLPHRMMHFGKRQPYSFAMAPFNDAAMDQTFPYPLAMIMDSRDTRNLNRYAYSPEMPFSSVNTDFVRLPNDVQNDDVSALLFPSQPSRYYPLPSQQGLARQTNQRLISNEPASASGSSLTSSELDNQRQQQQQSDPSFISVHTRSMSTGSGADGSGGPHGPAFNLPRSFISTLYGRQGTGLPGVGGYNKKAEPKDNFFMHFG